MIKLLSYVIILFPCQWNFYLYHVVQWFVVRTSQVSARWWRNSWWECFWARNSSYTWNSIVNAKRRRWCQLVISFPKKIWFLSVWSTSLLKTLWEKEKLLVTSNFSFSPQCFLAVWKTFTPFLLNWKLSSGNSLGLGESKVCRLGKVCITEIHFCFILSYC